MMGSSVLIFSIMAALVKSLSGVDTPVIVFFRFVLGMAILSIFAMFGRISLVFIKGKLLFLRGFIGCIAVFIFFFSISKLGIAKGTVIVYSYPIFASILSIFFLKEKVKLVKWVFIFAAFFGMYLLATDGKPPAHFFQAVGKYELLAMLGALCAGTAIVLVKKLHQSDSSYVIFFAQCLMGVWLFLIPSGKAGSIVNNVEIIFLMIIGIIATIGQLLMTEAYKYIPVTTGSLFHLMLPVFNVLTGLFIFKESISFFELTGSFIIVLACMLIAAHDSNLLYSKNNIAKI